MLGASAIPISNTTSGGEEMKAKQDASHVLSTAVRGARAVVDYSGLLGWSVLSRSGSAIKGGTSRMGKRIGRNMADPFVAIGRIFRKGRAGENAPDNEAIHRVEERISIIEEKLADLEKRGLRLAETGEHQKKEKELDDERRGLLALIVEENKELKSLLDI